MFKKGYLIIIISIIVFLISGVYLYENKKTIYIDSVLRKESYSYLPMEAKKYIKEVYEETGEVILTEKNKEDNKIYLNPKYIEYLELSDEEKDSISLIPDTYILDYSINQNYSNAELPSKFDLRNIDGNNFTSPIKNQGITSVCWAFASIENVETLYMKNNNVSYDETVPNFSVRQLDYITSTGYEDSSSNNYLAINGNWSSGMCTYSSGCSWNVWQNADNGSHELDRGGNFYVSSIAMANGITLTDESVMPWHEGKRPVLVNDIYGYDKSLYEVNSTIYMPTINEDNPSEDLINSYVSDVKSKMIQYGGPFVGTYSPQSTCGFANTDGSKVLKTDDCISNTNNQNKGHAMQIVGWDDDYEYAYCEYGTNHYSVDSNGTCSRGEYKTGQGAWILRNSWGLETTEAEQYSYVYLTYDSTRLSVGFTTSISDMHNRTWDNNYHSNPWIERKISNGMSNVTSQTKEFNTHNNNPEKIEKIKFITLSRNGVYNISILMENKNYDNIATVTTTDAGIYTIDLSAKNILLNNKIFSVKIESKNARYFVNDSISVFTSNTSNEPSIETHYLSGIQTYENPDGNPSMDNVAFVSSYNATTIKLEHYLKNISDYKKVSYKVLLDDVEYNNYFFNDYSSSSFSSNMVYIDGIVTTTLSISEERYSDIAVCGKLYTFQILYNNTVIESFPLKRICRNWDGNNMDYTISTIKFHKNDGSGYFSAIKKNDTTTFKIMKSDGTGNEYIDNQSAFFQYDKYIKSWNTKADGTGISYTDNDYFVYKDMDLYAQWSNPETEPHTYTVSWKCNRYICDSSLILSRNTQVTFNKEFTIPNNTFTNLTDGQEFIHWTFHSSDENSEIFYEEEKVKNISENGFKSPYNNDEIEYLEAVWSDSYHSVNFDANQGSGSMKSIKIINGKTARLKYNLFERPGFVFGGWNTKSDGTGVTYYDGESISLTKDITLYAMWGIGTGTITYNSNYGDNEISVQNFTFNISISLNNNTFVREGYVFKEWNTKSDGTGITYSDGQTINENNNLILYAIWENGTGTITYNSNYGGNEISVQNFTFNISTSLNNNIFVREGYVFKEWNTKSDGTGIIYSDGQTINENNNLILYAIWDENIIIADNSLKDIIEDNGYNVINGYVTKFTLGESIVSIKNKLGNDVIIETDKDIIATGTIIKKDNESYTVVIKGDLNGDGKINSGDLFQMRKYLLEEVNLTGAYKDAGIIESNREIKSLDLLRLRQYLLGDYKFR